MKILAMDASGQACSVAVYDGKLVGEDYQNNGLTHSGTLLPMADALLARLSISPREIDAVAVTIGPGSFTGLRIGMASAKGFADALQIPIAPVSALEVLALPVRETPCLALSLIHISAIRRKTNARNARRMRKS